MAGKAAWKAALQWNLERLSGGDEIDPVRVDFDDLCALRFEPLDHLLEQIASDLRDTGGGFEISKVSLGEAKVSRKNC
jgi:hypothetical protein